MLRRLSCFVVASMMVAAGCSSDGGGTTSSSDPAESTTADVSTSVRATADPSVHIVTIAKGVATVTGADGSTSTIDLPKGFSPVAVPTIGRWLIDGANSDTLTYIDLRDGTVSTVPLGVKLAVRKESIEPTSDLVIVGSSSDYGPLEIVDLASGAVTPAGEEGTEYAFLGQTEADLRYQALDRTSTVLVPLADLAKSVTFQGVVIDRTADRTLTLLPEADGPSVGLLIDGNPSGTRVALTRDVVGMTATPSGALSVESTGVLSSIDFADGAVSSIGDLGHPVKYAFGLGSGRTLVSWDTGAVLLDEDGVVLTSFPERPGIRLLPVWTGAKCALLQPATLPSLEGAGAVLLDVENATVLHVFDATPSALSVDGCDVVTAGNPSELFLHGELVDTGLYHLQAITADGNWAIGNQQDDTATKLFMDVQAGSSTALPKGVALLAVFDPA